MLSIIPIVVKSQSNKVTIRYHFIPIRISIIKKIDINIIGRDVEKFKPSYIASGKGKWYSHFGKESANYSQSKTDLPCNPAILLLDMY